ncbi:hypothetical protein IPL85_05740 [Candidatus Saccharibacteria bacterium]|nr:MAG: hypothetical protein IPL85_05740 [Candidatus Saccharibacteria bacterium]
MDKEKNEPATLTEQPAPFQTESSNEGVITPTETTSNASATSSDPMTSSSGNATILSIQELPEKRGWLKSYAYLPEYFVMLVVLTALLFALTNLLNIGIDSLISAEKSTGDDFNLYDFSNFELVSSLSSVIVGLPFFIMLYLRTKSYETESPAVVTHRWRKGFLGVFIVVQIMTIIGNLSGLVYQIVSRMVDGNDNLSLLTSATQGDPVWQLVIASVLNTALIGFAVFVIGKEYRKQGAK